VFDDALAIVDNTTIRSLWTSLPGGPDQYPTAGRPLLNASFALNYAVGGLTPWGYQATNLALHVLCAFALFGLTRRLLLLPRMPALLKGQGSGFATALALLWVVHPLNSEIVDYATQRSEAMIALALLGTLYFGLRAVTAARAIWWDVASVLACAAGMACKESMAVAPVLMLVLDATFISGGLVVAIRKRPSYYAALFGTEILLGLLIIDGPRSKTAGFNSGVSPWAYLLNQAPLIVRYLRLAVWPTGLVFDYGESTIRTLGDVWPAAAALLAVLVATVIAWFRAPALAFLGAWFFMTLAPTSSLVPIATEVGAERRMYLPLMAVLAAILVAGTRLLQTINNRRTRRIVAMSIVCAIAVVCVSLALVRNGEYATGVSLWQTVVERRPTGRAHYQLGLALKAAGRRDDAIAQYRLAVDTIPDADYALGYEAAADGRHQEAAEYYRTFLRLKPADGNVPLAYYNLGQSLKALGRHEEAITAFRETLARQASVTYQTPGLAESFRYATGSLADSLLAMQRWGDAVKAYSDYLRIVPGDPTALFSMGLALTKLDKYDEAREAFAAVVNQQTTNVAARVNLGLTLAKTGHVEESVRQLRRAVELETDPAAKRSLEQQIADLTSARD
jgi:Flp pilus assembly protein TadD